MAAAIIARYGGKTSALVASKIGDLLTPNEMRRGEILGRTLLLGHRFSASVPDLLEKSSLRIDADGVRLEVVDSGIFPDSDAVQARLRQLAKVAGVAGTLIVGG